MKQSKRIVSHYVLTRLPRPFLGMILLSLAGCQTLPPPTPPIPPVSVPVSLSEAVYAPAQTAIPYLIGSERDGIVAGDLAFLSQLWTPDARIIDRQGTTTTDDDYVWLGRQAVLDRYTIAVFPQPPPPLSDRELENIHVQGVVLLTEGRTVTVENGSDTWTAVYKDGRWWLHELAYN